MTSRIRLKGSCLLHDARNIKCAYDSFAHKKRIYIRSHISCCPSKIQRQTKKEEGDGKRGDTLKYMRVDIIYKFVAYNSGAQRTMASIQNVGYIPGTSWISLRSSSCVPPSWCAMRVFAFSCVFQSGALCARGLILCLSPEPSFPFTGNHYLCVFTWMCVCECVIHSRWMNAIIYLKICIYPFKWPNRASSSINVRLPLNFFARYIPAVFRYWRS